MRILFIQIDCKNSWIFCKSFFSIWSIWKWIGAMKEDFFRFWLRHEKIEKNCSKMAEMRPIFKGTLHLETTLAQQIVLTSLNNEFRFKNLYLFNLLHAKKSSRNFEKNPQKSIFSLLEGSNGFHPFIQSCLSF